MDRMVAVMRPVVRASSCTVVHSCFDHPAPRPQGARRCSRGFILDGVLSPRSRSLGSLPTRLYAGRKEDALHPLWGCPLIWFGVLEQPLFRRVVALVKHTPLL